jgi:hypothetical protein
VFHHGTCWPTLQQSRLTNNVRGRFDASGKIMEHYLDGDLVNEDTTYSREAEAPSSSYVFGPPNVPSFCSPLSLEKWKLLCKGRQKLTAETPGPFKGGSSERAAETFLLLPFSK